MTEHLRRRGASLLVAASAMAACGSGSTVTAVLPAAESCDVAGVVSLAAYEAVTITCNSGSAIDLAGNGASYLVVPQFATGSASLDTTMFVLGPEAAVVSPSAPASPVPSRRGDLQSWFDQQLRARARQAATTRESSPGSLATAPQRVSPAPSLNSIRSFSVLSSTDVSNPAVTTVDARLAFVGGNLLLYVDTLAPAGLSASDFDHIGTLFDQTLYPLDLDAFGPPSDIDGNGRLIALMSPVVNGLTPSAQCQTQGYIAGFFDGFDLSFPSHPSSNGGEIFYTIVPDPSGSVSCAHALSSFLATVPATFLHEVQHLISFGQHVVVHNRAPEQGWLDEGLSRVAEELGSIHYEALYPPPAGRTNPAQLFPDSAQGFIAGVLLDSYQYLLGPGLESATLHDDSDDGLAWRGADWLLLRWLGDQFGTPIYKSLEESTLVGTSNIATAAGSSFASLFGDFSLALYTDSLPGVARSLIPPRVRFTSRNLRRMYQAVYNAAGPSADVPRAFPILVTQLDGSAALTASMVPGTMSYYRLTTASGSGTARLLFSKPGGGNLPASLHPQVSVFRLS
jgi:hypothetical protein